MLKSSSRPLIILLVLVALAMLFSLVACTSTSTTTPSATSTPPPATTPPPTSPPPTTTTPPFPTASVPPEVTQYAADWPLPNRDYANTRATTDSMINSGNINTLGAAWIIPIPGQGIFGAASTTPIIMGDTVYFHDLGNNIFAIDIKTGTVKWRKLFNVPNIGPNGVAVGWGKVFGTSDPFNIVALDMNNGDQLWKTRVSNLPTSGVDIQPSVYGDLVLVSTVPGSGAGDFYAGGGYGTIYALDQETGDIVWSFNTVDSTDIWGNPDVNSGGGSWYPPAIDTATDISFWGIGNPAPFPGTEAFPNGSSRPGPNLYTDSIVALDGQTGQLKWYTQANQHDNYDLDFQISPILTSADISGKQQGIVIGAGKLGRVFAFNRETGAILWITNVGLHQNDQLANIPNEGVRVYPGIFGGVETPMAYADGVIYVPVVNLYTDFTPASLSVQPFNEGTGELVAIEVATGKILWDKALPSMNFGGATVVNDLVFTSTFDGMVYAFNRTSGEQVWSYQAPGGVNAWPAFADDTMLLPVGIASPFPALMAFKLGTTAPVIAITPSDGATLEAGDITVSAMVLNINLVEKLGDVNVTGEGHLHYFMDVDAPTAPGVPAVPSTGVYAATANTSFTFHDVPPGTHTFSVEIVNNNHTPLVPPVVAKVTVTVTAPPPPTTTPPTPQSVTINLVAVGFDFDQTTITVPAGAVVTMIFDNRDAGVPHNFALYTNSSASTSIFIGELINGPRIITYTFTAPSTPGSYFFRCDAHPISMTGTFIVQ